MDGWDDKKLVEGNSCRLGVRGGAGLPQTQGPCGLCLHSRGPFGESFLQAWLLFKLTARRRPGAWATTEQSNMAMA